MKMEATIILARCQVKNLLYGIRVQKEHDGQWECTWSFPIDERRARNEGYDDTRVQGEIYLGKGYPGCSYCGATGFVGCGKCRKLTCWDGRKKIVCQWCGNEMSADNLRSGCFDVPGGDI